MDEPSTVDISPAEQAALVAHSTDLSASVAVAIDACLENLQAVLTARAIRVTADAADSEYARGARAAFLLAVKAVEACRLAAQQGLPPQGAPDQQAREGASGLRRIRIGAIAQIVGGSPSTSGVSDDALL